MNEETTMAYEDVFKSIKVKNKIECFGDVNTEMKRPDRYYLEEYFSQTPGVNGDLANATEATRVPRNKHFEILGTNGTSALATFSATRAGLVLTTAGADNDQMIVLPHLDTAQTAWTGIKWGTENQTIWESTVTTGDDVSTGVLYWAGLKLTNTPTIATDNEQACFRFSTDDSNTTWRVISSVAGADTNTDSGVTVAANTTYRLKVAIGADRKASFFINDAQVHKTATELANDIDLIPYVGIQALNGAAEFMLLHNEKISRILFE
jgi:hypothetical protein